MTELSSSNVESRQGALGSQQFAAILEDFTNEPANFERLVR